jgi:hypothetical protein
MLKASSIKLAIIVELRSESGVLGATKNGQINHWKNNKWNVLVGEFIDTKQNTWKQNAIKLI